MPGASHIGFNLISGESALWPEAVKFEALFCIAMSSKLDKRMSLIHIFMSKHTPNSEARPCLHQNNAVVGKASVMKMSESRPIVSISAASWT